LKSDTKAKRIKVRPSQHDTVVMNASKMSTKSVFKSQDSRSSKKDGEIKVTIAYKQQQNLKASIKNPFLDE
jgi:hypothetical protein